MIEGGWRGFVRVGASCALGLLCVTSTIANAEPAGGGGSPDQRARRLVGAMTLDEKIGLLHTTFGLALTGHPQPKDALGSAGFNQGLSRLGIPPLQETDAGLGVADPKNLSLDTTALPSSLALGAAFDVDLARRAGAVLGSEARALGFNVLLGPGANLIREPRGGRNFEYVSEDPLLTGEIAGAEVAGIQSRKVVAALKHFVLNAQENGRIVLNAKLAEAPLRESDLLAFELAADRGSPGALMASYNLVNGAYASENAHLLRDVAKGDWNFPGWIMADWGGTHATSEAALAGLDQESGEDDDVFVFFDAPLKAAVAARRVPVARIDEMARRILRAEIAAGIFDDPPRRGERIDREAHARVAQDAAERGIVLLKNEAGILPLKPQMRRLLVVGGHADIGVLSGGGSSQVKPVGSTRHQGVPPRWFGDKPRWFHPSPPLAALRRMLPGTEVAFDDGHDPDAAARAAREADIVVVFADRWSIESLDLEDLCLPGEQNRLIAGIAAANPRTIVVLETPSGVLMPWLDNVAGVLEAWYPGGRGGEAIANVLTGKVNPSGRLPVTFPVTTRELPRATIPPHDLATSNSGEEKKTASIAVDYNVEGADVGYKWYLRTHRKPLFPFGFGLSYTRFAISGVEATPKTGTIGVAFDVRNIGDRAGIDTPQVYLDGAGFTRRLVGWGNAALKPDESKHVTLDVDPRLIARFDVAANGWRIDGGRYKISVRPNALDDGPAVVVDLGGRLIPAQHGPCGVGAPAQAGGLCVGSR